MFPPGDFRFAKDTAPTLNLHFVSVVLVPPVLYRCNYIGLGLCAGLCHCVFGLSSPKIMINRDVIHICVD